MDIKARLGARVKALRERTGLSQDELARAAQLSRNFVGAIERGEKAATIETLERVARALAVSLATLCDLEGRVRRSNPAIGADAVMRRIRALAGKASPAELRRFERVARGFFSR